VQVGKNIQQAIQLLNDKQVIGLPTETVYGLAANAFEDEAVLKIFEVKNRPAFNPLIIHTDSLEKVSEFVTNLPEKARLLGEAFWPGPMTLLLPKSAKVGDLVTSGSPLVAIRIPNHPLTLQLLSQLDYPLAAPSANKFGSISPTIPEAVVQQLGDGVQYVLDGGTCAIGIESTIIGFEGKTPIIYRTGGLALEDIEAVVGKVKVNKKSHEKPLTSGMMKSHYAPSTPFYVGNIEELISKYQDKKIGVLSFSAKYNAFCNYTLSPTGDVREAAKNLFNYMRLIDKENIDVIVSEYLPNKGLGRGVNDRLLRANNE
jgi:L-threonylcarbamoyladenylate synthase